MFSKLAPTDTAHLFPLIQYLRLQGHDTTSILHAMGLNRFGTQLEQLPLTLSLKDFMLAISKAKAFSNDPSLCLRAGQQQTAADFSLLPQLCYYSRDIEQVLRLYCRYLTAFNPGFPTYLVITETEIDTPISNLDWPINEAASLMELRLSNCIRFLRVISGDQQPDLIQRIQFEHANPDTHIDYDELLQTEVRFNQPHASMVIRRDALHRQIPTCQPDMLEKVIEMAEDKRLAAGEDSSHTVVKVRAAIRSGLATQKSTLNDIAERLNTSISSLKRLLAADGCGFQQLLDLERKQEMEYWMAHTPVTLESVCQKLGYASQASFNQACHRIMGMSPSAFRKQSTQFTS
ncbi:MAG: AraC-like DNA-binding protein [Oleispira sp.]|jgi:AraC-like DNA-binding protein|tara:strand:+ start:136 stop:1176 length:1041 start_codon:yes stop_codon:yes gene_type:complete